MVDFNKVISEFLSACLNIMKVRTLCVCLQSITVVIPAALHCFCRFRAAALTLDFPSSRLRIYTCLILTSHFLPSQCYTSCQNLVYPQQEVV